MQVRKQQLEPDMEQRTGSKLVKKCIKAVYRHPAYLTYMQEYIMGNVRLDEAQAEMTIAGRNINNLRYADDTSLMAESKKPKSLLMKVKVESENVELKANFSLSSFTFIKRLFSYSSLSAIKVVSSAYLRLLIFLLAILIPACASSSPAFLMMYSLHRS